MSNILFTGLKIPVFLMGFLVVSAAAAQTSKEIQPPEGQGAKVIKQEDQYLCVGRNAAGDAFQEQHGNLLDAINRACILTGEGTKETPALIDILTSGDSGAHTRKGGRFGIAPLSHQTLDFHSHLYTVINGKSKSANLYGFYIGRVPDDKNGKDPRTHITVKKPSDERQPQDGFPELLQRPYRPRKC